MNIAVCLKLVPATTAELRIAPDGQSLQLAGVEKVVSPYDEYALEAALKLRETFPGSTTHALTVGGDDALRCLQHAFSLGVDSGTHVAEAGLDARAAAKALAAVLREAPAEIILCGRQAIDDDQWLFPGALAEFLNIPHVSAISALTPAPDAKSIRCKRRYESGEQTLEAFLPAVVSCDKGLNEPRTPTLKGRLDAKKKQPQVKSAAALGLAPGEMQPTLQLERLVPPPQKSAGKVITAEPADAARELVRLLRDEAKVV